MIIPLRQLLSCCCNHARTKGKAVVSVRSLLSALLKVRELTFPITSPYLNLFLHQCLLSHFIFIPKLTQSPVEVFLPTIYHFSYFISSARILISNHHPPLQELFYSFLIWFLASISSFNLITTVQPSYL